MQPEELYSGLCSFSNQMTFKSAAHLYLNTASVCCIFYMTISNKKRLQSQKEMKIHCCYCTEKEVHKNYLPAIGREWILILSNSVGKLALTSSQSFIQDAFMPAERHPDLWNPCYDFFCSSINFSFQSIFCYISSFPTWSSHRGWEMNFH